MSNETKRDVLKKALDFFVMRGIEQSINYDVKRYQYLSEYDSALPDDLPVIPKAVSEWIKECKHNNTTLADTLCMEMRPESVRSWMAFKDGEIANGFDDAGYHRKQEIMAKAWVLGVWRVEETGEIVKVEDGE
ncbi:hypothetical protein ABC645_12125 [Lacticaseibacillus paracasei]